MDFCSNCGNQLNVENKFCSKCGKKVKNIETKNIIDEGVETVVKGVNTIKNEISQSEYVNKAKEGTINLVSTIWGKIVMFLGYVGLLITTVQLISHFFLDNKLQIIQDYERYGLNNFWTVFSLNLILVLSFLFMFLSGIKRHRLLFISVVYFFLFLGAFLGNKNQNNVTIDTVGIENQGRLDTIKDYKKETTEMNLNGEMKEFKYSEYLTGEIINRAINDISPRIKNYKIKSVFEQWIKTRIKNEEFGIMEVFNFYWNKEDRYNYDYNGPGDVFSSDDVSFGFADINSDGMEDCYVSIEFWAAGSASTIWKEYTFFVSNGENYVIDEDFHKKISERISNEKENKIVSYFSNIDISSINNSGMILSCFGYDIDDARCCPSIERHYSYGFQKKELKLLN